MQLCLSAALGLSALSLQAAEKPMQTVPKLQLDRYLGVWYEIARKPMYFENKCKQNIRATYGLNEKGNVTVENRCEGENNQIHRAVGEAFVVNPPENTKLKVSFLPKAIRWIPIARGNYWVLKLDDQYQTVLIGEPSRKYLWLLSRQPTISEATFNDYMNTAQNLGYSIQDLIITKQIQK
ncbi:lipocalin family protein [Acinetobacter sp. MD2(2019)]|uniref:lipocalin family protein n=1 Tax=Acinetobacter sp. MD2(2019) TaxID=2605273 RepID=UPI002D77B6A0|nr:lipocalin family protein [Acinetobacter sp. MD2(2019)]